MKQDGIISPNAAAVKSAEVRLRKHDWDRTGSDLNSFGCAVIDKLLTREECREIAALYPKEEFFRSHIHMARHGFGKGEYRYFKYPLPDLLGGLRTPLYPHLAVVANSWNEHMNVERRYPERHAEFLRQCHAAGQTRPTPLLLQYVPGDFNCLHQDLRRPRFSSAGRDSSFGTGSGLYGRGVRHHRTAAADAEPRRNRSASAGRRRCICRA
jgi:hypothetical protein